MCWFSAAINQGWWERLGRLPGSWRFPVLALYFGKESELQADCRPFGLMVMKLGMGDFPS